MSETTLDRTVRFGVLGPLEAVVDGTRLDLGAHRQRALLTIFLLHVDEVVSLDRLIDQLWGDAPPNTATGSLQAYVSNLRRVLEPDRGPRQPARVLVTEAPGYRLRVDPDTVDAVRFERLVREARGLLADDRPAAAADRFDEALALWRGQALIEFRYERFVDVAVSRLDEMRAAAEEDRVVAQLALHDPAGAVIALERLVGLHPLRERLRALQMVALYRLGRQAEALRVFDATRRLLADELGLQPGPELQTLFRQVLEHDPALDSAAPATVAPAPETPAGEQLAPLTAPTPPPAGGSFVGRAEVLGPIVNALDQAGRGQARFVLVGGEPGIGKTRLAEEVSARAESLGTRVAWGRCHDDEGMPALWPWVQVIAGLLDVDATTRVSLADLLGMDDGVVDAAAPDQARFRLYDEVRQVIEQRAVTSSVMVVLDDLQWADPSSLRLLRYLAVELRPSHVLVLGTFHEPDASTDGPLASALADLGRRSATDRYTMSGWTQEEIAELVRLDAMTADIEIDSVAAELHRRTDGNPFFVTELVRLLVSERTLQLADRSVDIPLVVSDVIRRRLRRLPDNVHGVLGVAAIVGREFDLDVLHLAAGLAIDDAFEILEAAVMARVVVQTQAESYRFSHGLVRETLYSDLTPGRRARLHAKVAEAIESAHAADVQRHVSQLAHHFAAAGRTGSAVHYSVLAAEQAESSFAYDEAVAHWNVAIELADRNALAERARMLIRLGVAYRGAGDALSSANMLDLALDAANSSGDLALLAEAALTYGEVGLWQVRDYGAVNDRVVAAISTALAAQPAGDSTLRARLLTGLAVAVYYQESERERGRDLVREAAAVARRRGDRRLLASILGELIILLDAQPNVAEQLAVAEELATLLDSDTPFDIVATARMRNARTRLVGGDATGLEEEINEIARRADEERHALTQLWATWARTGIAFLNGRLDDAEALAGEARDRHQQLGIWGGYETYASHMTAVWREQGRLGEIGVLVEPLLEKVEHPGARKLLAIYRLERGAVNDIGELMTDIVMIPPAHDFSWLPEMCLTAEIWALAGLAGAEQIYAELKPFDGVIVAMDGTFICMGATSYYLGLLADALARHDDAIHHLEQAVELNDRVGCVPWSVRSRYHLARVIKADDLGRAKTLVAEALETAERHGLVAMQAQLQHALS